MAETWEEYNQRVNGGTQSSNGNGLGPLAIKQPKVPVYDPSVPLGNIMDTNYLRSNIDELGLPALSPDAMKAWELQNPGANIHVGDVSTGPDEKLDTSVDWGMKGYGGVALGAGQLGLGVLSYMDQSKTADKNRQIMDQQIANNEFALSSARDYKAALAKHFGSNKG